MREEVEVVVLVDDSEAFLSSRRIAILLGEESADGMTSFGVSAAQRLSLDEVACSGDNIF